jgi:hypothetical protein
VRTPGQCDADTDVVGTRRLLGRSRPFVSR